MASENSATFSIRRLMKEIYLSIFVLFFKISMGKWPDPMNMNPVKGVLGNFIMELFLLMSAYGWCSVYMKRPIDLNKAEFVVSALLLVFINYYFLVHRKIGTDFERQFSHFQRSKQLGLLLAGGALFVAVVFFLFFSASAYHRAFNIR